MKAILLTILIIIAGMASAQNQYQQNYQYQPPAEEPSRVPIPEPPEPVDVEDYIDRSSIYHPPSKEYDIKDAVHLLACDRYSQRCRDWLKQ